MTSRKKDIEKDNPPILPSLDGRGVWGDKKGDHARSPDAPHRVHNCPKPNMVQGKPSPLPPPTCSPNKFFGRRERLRAGKHQGRGGTRSSQCLFLGQAPILRAGRSEVKGVDFLEIIL